MGGDRDGERRRRRANEQYLQDGGGERESCTVKHVGITADK